MMDRRAFIGAVAGLLVAPLAQAQPAGKIYRIGLLSMGTIAPRVTMWSAFLDALRELDYVEGGNLVVRRGAAGDGRPDRLPEFVAGFLRDGVDVIVTTSTRETEAAKRATSTVPIVMTLSPDPVGQGLVASLARPGGNVTGLTNLVPGVSQKYVELLKQIAPSTSAFVVVTGPRGPFAEILHDLDLAALRVGVGLSYARVDGPVDIDSALTHGREAGAGGIIVAAGRGHRDAPGASGARRDSRPTAEHLLAAGLRGGRRPHVVRRQPGRGR